MLDEFNRIQAEVERVAYFDGVPTDTGGVITTLTMPNATLEPLRYVVSAAAMSEAGKHLRRHRLVRLAQVHTHPTDWTDHSKEDDRRAYSQEQGAISIVLPYHGFSRPHLNQAGIHIREAYSWRKLKPSEVSQHLQIVPSVLDFRKN